MTDRGASTAAGQGTGLGLPVAFDEETGGFAYVQPVDPLSRAGGEPIELAPEPSWGRVAYRR